MPELVGTPSDDVPGILAEGRSGVSTIFVSLSTRHPEGRDADYLYWHTFDHRPEQHRLPTVRASLRIVSTPQCRAERAADEAPYDDVDHVMTYFFADPSGLDGFVTLSDALGDAGRKPYLLPAVDRGVYHLDGLAAAPRIKAGADILPWWPALGIYLMIEEGAAPAADLTGVDGVGGVWWGSSVPIDVPGASEPVADRQVTYAFLDGDPVETARRLRPVLEQRWAKEPVRPLLAAPFFTLVPQDLTRYLP